MSADIEKLAVMDTRVVQSRPKFAVEKGALSLTNAPFNAIAATQSQHTYNIYVPSENVFVDRKLLWSSSVNYQMTVAIPVGEVGDGLPIVRPGTDFSLCQLPLNSLCATMSATINDTTTVINSQDVMREVLRLTDYKKNRLVRTAPTMMDKYATYNDAWNAKNNPIGSYDDATDYDNVPNGAYPLLQFASQNGSVLSGVGSATVEAGANTPYVNINGVACQPPAWNGANAFVVGSLVRSAGFVWRSTANILPGGAAPVAPVWTQLNSQLSYPVYIKWRTTEPLVLSPFIFADECEWDTGLFGINNIQLIMNLRTDVSRVLRCTSLGSRTITGIGYNTLAPNPFENSVINVQFLTPPLDVPLPPKSVVPYMEFPRYITSYQSGTVAPGAIAQIQSQTITLPSIPDLLLIYVRPSAAVTSNPAESADFYLPLASAADNVRNPISVNFDNFSGLLSSHTTEELYSMSVKNGLDMDFATFLGQGKFGGAPYSFTDSAGAPQSRLVGQTIPLVGSLLVLKPSQDITLQSGQSPSLVGNFTLQFNIQVKNTTTVDQIPQLYVVTANSGFFESIRGSSRVIKSLLSEQDIISAPLAPHGVRAELDRIVGGFSFSSLGNILSKARDVYQATKPMVSAVKGMLPEEGMLGRVKSGLSTVGYGTGAGTGAGAGAGRGKRSLASRLM